MGGAVVGAGVGEGVLAGTAGAAGTAVTAAVLVGVDEAVLVEEVLLPGIVWLADAPHPATSKVAMINEPIPAAVLRTDILLQLTNQHNFMWTRHIAAELTESATRCATYDPLGGRPIAS